MAASSSDVSPVDDGVRHTQVGSGHPLSDYNALNNSFVDTAGGLKQPHEGSML
jgi:hypothetical protein